ncbi:flagellar biosynthesis protein FlhA [Ferrimonas marina]|uniref:Flagellar biosynthesis protein FlhA n=1 Tax=Ferrimonas marina TaxID=299255 RepID=A0A1M5TEV1_9GAMM|nr:FHIPEP family type III secretion protein [Ferrimonas marina]SHH49239.1 flagellar biosynthesis protein FlhA [Ferrimonas marina]
MEEKMNGRIFDKLKAIAANASGAPLLLLIMLAMITVPLPAAVLDSMFTINILLSIVILLVAVRTLKPTDFSVFPTVLLMATLTRLGLNVASTRIILTEGHTGSAGAGHVIEAFGTFVIGGNWAVGLVVFLILLVVNFIVITKGAERISEVNARFTLDSLPGKQLAIDADLNQGAITADEAGKRRKELALESEFNGALDGTSKFVKGDAIAGIVILLINIIGGLIIGVVQHGIPFTSAVETYTLLSIGDGLVAQIPSIILASATALIISRSSTDVSLSDLVQIQIFDDPRTLYMASGLIIAIGLVPGMPTLPFVGVGLLLLGITHMMAKNAPPSATEDGASEAAASPVPGGVENFDGEPLVPVEKPELSLSDITPPDPIVIELGMRLTPLVDELTGDLKAQAIGTRQMVSQEYGILIQSINIRTVRDLDSESYRILIRGIPRAKGKVKASLVQAINMDGLAGEIDGIPTNEPVFGLPAFWISKEQESDARSRGYVVTAPASIIASHLNQVMIKNLGTLLGHEDVSRMMDHLRNKFPRLIDELIPKTVSVSRLLTVMRYLLSEQISLSDMSTVLETIARYAPQGLTDQELADQVRKAMVESIIYHLSGSTESLDAICLDGKLQMQMLQGLNMKTGDLSIEPELARDVIIRIGQMTEELLRQGKPAVLFVPHALRLPLVDLVRPIIRELNILSTEEIPKSLIVNFAGTVGYDDPVINGD